MTKKRTGKVALGTALAAGLGYVAGVLTAPKSGKNTRKDIARSAIRAKKEAEQNLKNLHSELTKLMNKAKSKTKGAGNKAQAELTDALDKAQAAKDKARELLSALHEGEAEDKDLQKAISDVKRASEHLKKYMGKHAKPTAKK